MKYLIRGLIRFIFNLIARVDAGGYEHLPKDTSFVIATNHLGIVDVPIAFYALDRWDSLTNNLRDRGASQDEIELSGLAVRKDQGGFYDRFRGRLAIERRLRPPTPPHAGGRGCAWRAPPDLRAPARSRVPSPA